MDDANPTDETLTDETSPEVNGETEDSAYERLAAIRDGVRRILGVVAQQLHEVLSGPGATIATDLRGAFGHILASPHLGRAVMALAVALYLASGIFVVNPGEEAVVRRFGRITGRSVGEGLRYRLPWPIEQVDKVNVSEVRREGVGLRPPEHAIGLHPPEEVQILTGDENIVSIKIVVQYRIKDAAAYLFKVDVDPNPLIRNAVKSALTALGGRDAVDDLLTTRRPDLQRAVQTQAQKVLDSYESGIQLVSVNLQEVYPPKEVAEAFRDVASAREEKAATINDAQGYMNSLVPQARGDAQRTLREAEGYKTAAINKAQGDAQRFTDVLAEYRNNAAQHSTDVTRLRYYLETMEKVLPKVKKFIVNPTGQGVNVRLVQ